ncbi:DUF5684 domain-containing protein [Candidatus Saccharibacteria bacterium]|nr:DUF5684 domain-containing protein [Candidatus Saccharibacteria bacterium]
MVKGNYSYNLSSGRGVDSSEFLLYFLVGLVFIMAIVAAVYIIMSLLMMQMFKKFNVAGWKAWVPFVNTWTFMELGGQHGWWQFVPIASFIFPIIAAYNIGLKFGKDGVFVLLYLFLAPVWFIIMALKSTTLVDDAASAGVDVTGLGITADQAVFAKPVEPVDFAEPVTEDAAPVEDSPAETETEDTTTTQ